MHTTPPSLLERLRQPGDQEAWERFVELYTPLIFYWARGVGLQDQDAADLVQDVFTLLVQKLAEFNYDEHKSFRGWLRTVTLNLWRNDQRRRAEQPVDADGPIMSGLASPDEAEKLWEAEYRDHLVQRALEVMQREFEPSTWQAFWECTANGRPAAEVAAQLGMSVGAVYVAKSRVLHRVRQELQGLLE